MDEWFIKLKGNKHDLDHLRDMLRSPHAEVVEEDNVYYLKSIRFQEHDDPHEVHKTAIELVSRLKGTMRIVSNQTLSVAVAGIERTQEDSPRTQFIMAGFIGPTARLFAPRVVHEGDTAPIKRQETFLELIAATADCDDAVAKVTRLVGETELNWVDLYRIYEVIEHDLGSRSQVIRRGWLSNAEIDRLTHTADNPHVSGDAARHGATKYRPPKNPMSLEEAQSLVLKLANQWLSTK